MASFDRLWAVRYNILPEHCPDYVVLKSADPIFPNKKAKNEILSRGYEKQDISESRMFSRFATLKLDHTILDRFEPLWLIQGYS